MKRELKKGSGEKNVALAATVAFDHKGAIAITGARFHLDQQTAHIHLYVLRSEREEAQRKVFLERSYSLTPAFCRVAQDRIQKEVAARLFSYITIVSLSREVLRPSGETVNFFILKMQSIAGCI